MDTPAPLPIPGDNITTPRPCGAPNCTRRTTLFAVGPNPATGIVCVIHFCPEHVTWAARESGVQAWWKEKEAR